MRPELGLEPWSIWIGGEKSEGIPSEKAPQEQRLGIQHLVNKEETTWPKQ